ncbi:MAG: hypothetical protein ABIQ93_15465, partial [Saprospiraceae bacterium]
MAKKYASRPAAAPPKSPKPPRQTPPAADMSPDTWMPWVAAGLAFVLFLTGIHNKMVSMDDHTATFDNPAVTGFNPFLGSNLGMFAPVTWMGYALAFAIQGKEATTLFHVFSAVVHVINVLLVFHLFRRLGSTPVVALVVSLFFAIHPLQVEAVSWIAAFSTPLFALFSLLAMNFYLRHTEAPALGKNYWISLALFVVACLAKSAAVTLPLTLLVLDWWLKRPLNRQHILEKIPYFLVSLGFGIGTIITRTQAGFADTPADFNVLDRALMICHTLLFYWTKLLAPFGLSIWYPFVKTQGTWSWTYYAAPLVLLALLWLAWRNRAKVPVIWFGTLFYLSNIVLALPYATFGTFELRSDRYNYLAGLGFFFILASLPDLFRIKRPSWVSPAWGTLTVLALLWLVLAGLRIQDWKDTITLIDSAIATTGDNFGKAYLWRGMDNGDNNRGKEALSDFNRAITINPGLTEAYKYRGGLLGFAKRYGESANDLSKYLAKHPNDAEQYYNRG